MGAGIVEWDVTFTKDKELVCRHSQCDLHTTTNILAIPELAAKCSIPFMPADPATGTPAMAQCCTSDIGLDEFKMLKGKMDGEPDFGQQAVFLDGRYDDPSFDQTNPATWLPSMDALAVQGVKIIAPPMWMLVALDGSNKIVPSTYTIAAKAADLDIVTWTLERSGLLKYGSDWYHQTTNGVINNDGDTLVMLDVLPQDVGIKGIFSDRPATVTYYANCMGLE